MTPQLPPTLQHPFPPPLPLHRQWIMSKSLFCLGKNIVSPNTTWCPSSHGVGTKRTQCQPSHDMQPVSSPVVMKNWLPLVFLPASGKCSIGRYQKLEGIETTAEGDALAMESIPGLVCFLRKFSSSSTNRSAPFNVKTPKKRPRGAAHL